VILPYRLCRAKCSLGGELGAELGDSGDIRKELSMIFRLYRLLLVATDIDTASSETLAAFHRQSAILRQLLPAQTNEVLGFYSDLVELLGRLEGKFLRKPTQWQQFFTHQQKNVRQLRYAHQDERKLVSKLVYIGLHFRVAAQQMGESDVTLLASVKSELVTMVGRDRLGQLSRLSNLNPLQREVIEQFLA